MSMSLRALLGVALFQFALQSVVPGQANAQAAQDEARQAGRTVDTFKPADEDWFHDMDGGGALSPEAVKGRNMWMAWTGGNDRLWDELTRLTFGSFDLLKIISSHPNLKYSRDNRFKYFGVVNEPCFEKAAGPNKDRFGLWLDGRSAGCTADPFENTDKYPGVAVGARGKTQPVGSYYGYATGVLGLRLFPNPAFDEEAAKRWDPDRYYNDPSYYLSKDLVRPYRVGMACAFCHVGPNPVKPPADAEHPTLANLSGTVGAQYFWVDRLFAWDQDRSNFFVQTLSTARPGSLDTSLVSTDNINNPRTMNAVYGLLDRLGAAKRWGHETLGPDNAANRQFNDFVSSGPLTQFYQKPDQVWTAHILKDGSDSVGALGALNRVYINIGLYSEEWLRHFNALVGGKAVTPIEITTARANSFYWGATETMTPNMANYLVEASGPHRLKDAPGGAAQLSNDANVLRQGKIAFAENCAGCHSSKAPPTPTGADPGACIGPDYMACWTRYWEWVNDADFKGKMRDIVLADDFLDKNYLSNDMRVPVTLLQTNACSPLGTNAIGGNIWDNFSSESYKELPSVGAITVFDPFTGAPIEYQMPAGGRGYTRVPTLISAWSTAPFLLNNSVGKFDPSPSVEARLAVFQDSITQMLWPDKRPKDPVLGDKVPGVIDRTTQPSYLRIPAGYLPGIVRGTLDTLGMIAPNLFDEGGIEIGPIPTGTPVDLLANLALLPETDNITDRLKHDKEVVALAVRLVRDLKALPQNATDEQARQAFGDLGKPMFALSKCPDYVVNRGHYFGARLSDADKKALVEFIKTF
jgi:hypothetical protein